MADLTIPTNNSLPSYFVNTYVIKDITFESSRFQNDIAFTLHLIREEDENNYVHSVTFTGNLYKNGNIPVNISMLLVACGIMNVLYEDKKKIIAELLDKNDNVKANLKNLVLNKKIKMLKYLYAKDPLTGKLKYKFWNGKLASIRRTTNVFDISTPNNKIVDEFMLKVHAKNYPITDYNPDLLKDMEITNVEESDNKEDTSTTPIIPF